LLQEALLEERGKLQQRLAEEEEVGAGEPGGKGGAAEAVAMPEDPLDAFMSDVPVQLERGKVGG